MASAVFFLDSQGRPLLSRNFRGDVPLSSVDYFPQLIAESGEPFLSYRGVHYTYIRHSNVILLAISRKNTNCMAISYFLHQLVTALGEYVNSVEEESIRDNYVVIYELLDEMMDFGHVQTSDINLLRDYVTQSSYKLEVSQAISALTDKISWRPPGIWYKKNELFVDVSETVNATVSTDGQLNMCQILGCVTFRVYLSGMPLLKLGINDVNHSAVKPKTKYRASRYVPIEDVGLHQCVDLDEYERTGTISFVPPDGKFDLLTYRVKDDVDRRPLFRLSHKTEVKAGSRIQITCSITANYKRRQSCTFVEFRFPVPQDCDSPRSKISQGNIVYAPEDQAVIWRLKDFGGGRSASMTAELLLSRVGDSHVPNAPVTASFEIPGSTISGLQLRYLKITEDMLKYDALPWVRYITKSGDYEYR